MKKQVKNLRPRAGIGSIKNSYQKQIAIDPRAREFSEIYANNDDKEPRFSTNDRLFRQLVVLLASSSDINEGIRRHEKRQKLSEPTKSFITNNASLFESREDCQWLTSSYLSFRARRA